VGLAIVRCARRGNELGSRNRAASPPARRARAQRYPTERVPAAASVHSPSRRGEGASGTPWAHFEWGMRGNWGSQAEYAMRQLRLTLRAEAGWNARHPLCPRDPADPPPETHRAERRQLRGARQLRAPAKDGLFPKFGQFRKRMGSWCEKTCTGTHFECTGTHFSSALADRP